MAYEIKLQIVDTREARVRILRVVKAWTRVEKAIVTGEQIQRVVIHRNEPLQSAGDGNKFTWRRGRITIFREPWLNEAVAISTTVRSPQLEENGCIVLVRGTSDIPVKLNTRGRCSSDLQRISCSFFITRLSLFTLRPRLIQPTAVPCSFPASTRTSTN